MNTSTTNPTPQSTDTTPGAADNCPPTSVTADNCPLSTVNCTTPWSHDDYARFVHRYAAGAYPEVAADPTAWDHLFIPAGDPDAPNRPTLIARDDFDAHLPAVHRDSYGLLVVKLWEVARGKGLTAAFEQEQHRVRLEQQQREEQLRRQQLRGEIEALQPYLPAPEPKTPVDPRQQWYAAIMAAALPDTTLIEKVKHVHNAVIEGQPFRSALLQDSAAQLLTNTFGPLMFPESVDIMTNPLEPEIAEPEEPAPSKWTPAATSRQIVHGAARDLADLVSLLIARQKVSVGFEADHKTIYEVRQLTRSLRELNQIVRETHRQKPGPKPKSGLIER